MSARLSSRIGASVPGRRLAARLFGGSLFRGMAVLASGALAARVIGFAAIPVLTRIYAPADYGVLAVFTALLGLLAPLTTLLYSVAIPLPRSDGLAMNVMVLAASVALTMTALAAAGFWSAAPVLLPLLSMEALSPWRWLVVLGLLGTSIYGLLSMWATRRRAYGLIARTQLAQSGLGAVVKIGMGLALAGPIGLLAGQVVAQSAGIGSFLRRFAADIPRTARHVTWRRIVFVARRYRGFPIYRMPSQLLLAGARQAPILFVAALSNPATAGQFGIALTVIAIPVHLIGRSASQAYFAEIAALGRRRLPEINSLTRRTVAQMAAIAVAPALLLYLLAEPLSTIIFGPEWQDAGRYISYLALLLFSGLATMPVMRVFDLLERQALYLAINGLRLVIVVLLFGLLAREVESFDLVVLGYAVTMAVFHSLSGVLVLWHLNSRDAD